MALRTEVRSANFASLDPARVLALNNNVSSAHMEVHVNDINTTSSPLPSAVDG